jgi:hypothetical protein
MKRIGIAASKMAKDSLLAYNFFVVLIAFIFSLLIFFIAGSAITIALLIISFTLQAILPTAFKNEWISVYSVCMLALSVVVGLFNLMAVLKNIKFRLKRRF